jgi:hypothetical protein
VMLYPFGILTLQRVPHQQLKVPNAVTGVDTTYREMEGYRLFRAQILE